MGFDCCDYCGTSTRDAALALGQMQGSLDWLWMLCSRCGEPLAAATVYDLATDDGNGPASTDLDAPDRPELQPERPR
jgi:hypothetical protein